MATTSAALPLAPDAVIGHCMLVYDLDRLAGGGAFDWGKGR